MKQKTKRAFLIWGVLAVVVVGVGVAAYFGVFQAAIGSGLLGEEGYEPYDGGLAAGSINPVKFSVAKPSNGAASAGASFSYCPSYSGSYLCGSSYSGGASCNAAQAQVTPGNGVLSVSGGASASAKDLYLNNFKADVVLGVAKACYDTTPKGYLNSCVSSNRGWSYCSKVPAKWALPADETGVIEVKWDDYNAGHYQLFWRGGLVEEGNVSESSPLAISIGSGYGRFCDLGCQASSVAAFYNPRSQHVFGCDPQTNEYLIGRAFANGADFNIANLRGLKRFCTQIPAIHFKDGVVGASKQVYYALASGQTVTVGDNEIYKVFYIGNASVLGVPPNVCVGSAYDYTTKNCSSLTGIIDVCPAGYYFNNGLCIIQVENKLDYAASNLVGGTKATIALNEHSPRAYNGAAVVFEAAAPRYSGVASGEQCAVVYPAGGAAAWAFSLNGAPIVLGGSSSDGFFKVTMSRADAVVHAPCGAPAGYAYTRTEWTCTTTANGVLESFVVTSAGEVRALQAVDALTTCTASEQSYSADAPTNDAYLWQEVLSVERVKPLAVVNVSGAAAYDVAKGGDLTVKVQNLYGKPFTATVAVVYEEPIGKSYYYKTLTLPTGTSVLAVPARTPGLGAVRADVVVVYPLGGFGLLASDGASFEYQVANAQGATILALNQQVENLTSIIVGKEMTLQNITDYIKSLQLSESEKAAVIANLQQERTITAGEAASLAASLSTSQAQAAALQAKVDAATAVLAQAQPAPSITSTVVIAGLALLAGVVIAGGVLFKRKRGRRR